MTWDWSGCLFFVEYSVWLAGVRSDEVLFSDIAWKVNLVRSISQLSANRLKLREQTFTRKWSKKGVPPSHLLVKLTEQRFVRLRLHRNQRVLKFQVSVSLFSSFQMRLQTITHTHAKSLSNYASVQRFCYRWIFNHSVDLFKLFTTNWLGSLLERQDLILSLVLDLDGVSETNPSYARMKSDCDRSDFCEWWLPKHLICDLFQKARLLNLKVLIFFERWLKAQWKVVEQLLNAAIWSEGEAFSDKNSRETKTKNKNKQKTQKWIWSETGLRWLDFLMILDKTQTLREYFFTYQRRDVSW